MRIRDRMTSSLPSKMEDSATLRSLKAIIDPKLARA